MKKNTNYLLYLLNKSGIRSVKRCEVPEIWLLLLISDVSQGKQY